MATDLKQFNDYGFSTIREENLPTNVENTNTIWSLERDLKKQESMFTNRIHDILNAITPFLGKLKENPSHEFIKWPNRVEAIDKFRSELDDIAFPKTVLPPTSVPVTKEKTADGSTSNT